MDDQARDTPADGRDEAGGTRARGDGAAAYGRAAPSQDLRDRWHRTLLRAREGAPGPDPEPYARDLLNRWSQPHRKYHTLAHLSAVLDHVDALAAHAERDEDPAHAESIGDLDAVRLAAWFHDAVHRPDRTENEERSAALARRALTEAGVGPERTAEVVRLVLLTVTHDPARGDGDGEVLCDADLAVLAGTPEEYGAYAAAVREEYAFVPDEDFRRGRAEVLRQLLGLPLLFRTPHGRRHWEARARQNLATELELLTV